jgi:hypothetical protein
MNYKLILICIGALALAQEGDAFVAFTRFGRFPFFGGGLGFGRFGLFGPFGPFGFPFGPFGIPPVPFIGKRAAENMNITECGISTENNKIICAGKHELNCDVSSNFTSLGQVSFVIKDLALEKVTEEEQTVFHFLAEKEVDKKIVNEDHTFVNPADNKPITLSLYSSEKIDDLGFRFKEESCFEKFEKIVESVEPKEIEFQLFINQA